MVVVLAIVIVGIVASPWIVRAVAPGFGPETRALAVSLTRIMFIAILFTAAGGIFSNLLHCHRNFAIPGLGGPANNLVLIGAAVFLTIPFGIRGLAYGVVFGAAAHALIQISIVLRHRQDIKLRLDFRDPMFLGVIRLATPLLIGMAGAKLDDVVDRMFASMLRPGSISALAYAIRLIDIPREILVFGFSTVLLPYFSSLAAKGDLNELGDKLMTSLRVAFFVLFPVSIAMAVLGGPLVRLVFQRGQFDEVSVRYTVSALLLYTPTIWALGITSIMTCAFVALRDTKTPVIAGFVRLGVKIALVALLVRVFQHAGRGSLDVHRARVQARALPAGASEEPEAGQIPAAPLELRRDLRRGGAHGARALLHGRALRGHRGRRRASSGSSWRSAASCSSGSSCS